MRSMLTFIKGIDFHFVKNMKEVLELALGD